MKHETQPNNIFREKENPNKTQNELARNLTCIVTNQLIAWKELLQIKIMWNYTNINQF